MSAIRRTISRSIWRNANSSPYSRPATPSRAPTTTESAWSVLGYIHDLFITRRTKSPSPSEDEEVLDDPMQIREEEPDSPTQQATPPITPPQPTHEDPQTPTTSASVFDTHALALNTTPSKHQELVTQYLLDKEREGKSLNSVEVEGLIALLNKAKDDEVEPEQFRFSTTPTTPTRSPQPPVASGSIFSFSPTSSHTKKPISLAISSSLPTFTNASASTSTSSPRKVLTRNPNGEYRWIGGGSARRGSPARGRSASPAKSQHSHSLILTTTTSSKSADTKRRRVGADRESSVAESSGPRSGSLPSASGVNGVANAINSNSGVGVGGNGKDPVTPTPKSQFARPLRPSLNPRTTAAPAHPSPLRQSFAPASNPSTPGSSPSSSVGASPRRSGGQTTTTRAADVLSEIIEKVDRDTPKRVAQVANPYQTASPVKPVVKVKEVRRRTRAQVKRDGEGKEVKEGKEGKDVKGKGREDMEVDKRRDEEMPSPRAIIEATVPKGAKRSRPPAGLAKSTSQESSNGSPSLRRSARLTSPSPEPESNPAAANNNNKNRKAFSAFTVEEDDEGEEEDGDEDVSPTKRQRKVNGVVDLDGRGKSLEVVEIDDGDVDMDAAKGYTKPSEVVEPRETSSTPPPAQHTREEEREQPTSVFTSHSSPSPFATTTTTTAIATTATAKSPTTSAFGSFPLKSSAPKEPSKLRASYTAVEDEDTSGTSTPAATDINIDVDVPLKEKETNAPTPKVNGFAFATTTKDPMEAAKALPVSALPTFAFAFEFAGTLKDVNNVMGKARDAAKLVPVKELPSFDLTKPVPVSVPEPRKTVPVAGTSMFPSPYPSPGLSTSAAVGAGVPKAEIKAFDFGAAGMKPPTKSTGGKTWKCSTCDLTNPDSAQEKCTVCETPRPGGVSSSASGSASTPSAAPSPFAAFGGFGSAGAGGGTGMGTFKKVDWSAMGVPSQVNGAGAGSESSFTSASSTSVSVFATPTPTPAATSTPVKAFDWVAAGLAPKVTTGNEWKCKMCDLQNAESVTEKCQYCEAPKE
ncbi:hypothetical protein BD410DRAFT_827467 [Rickenella mellea]|uniref:RanBP2-type domain-containing protein n=1 Tax=Rickenella mellea TaxID=50990 RepID=A0A4Y7Q9Q7_9AGAM|nr:hypothetical protein BD410DRAFT_827467 [Rickenella mellea]